MLFKYSHICNLFLFVFVTNQIHFFIRQNKERRRYDLWVMLVIREEDKAKLLLVLKGLLSRQKYDVADDRIVVGKYGPFHRFIRKILCHKNFCPIKFVFLNILFLDNHFGDKELRQAWGNKLFEFVLKIQFTIRVILT